MNATATTSMYELDWSQEYSDSDIANVTRHLEMQDAILYWLIKDCGFRDSYLPHISKIDRFFLGSRQDVFQIFYTELQNGYAPQRKEILVLLDKRKTYGLEYEKGTQYESEIQSFLNRDRSKFFSLEFVNSQIAEYLKERIGLETAEKVTMAVMGNTPNEIPAIVRTQEAVLESVESAHRDIALVDYDSLVESVADSARRLSTGLVHVDCAMGGGLARGELMTVLGRTKSGKSHFLVNQMYANVLKGHNVLYISFENGVLDIQRRLMSRASGLFYSQMRRVPDHLKRDRIDEIRERTAYLQDYGKHLIVHRPPNTLTYKDLRALMARMESLVGARPDLIIIDYADYLNIVPVTGQRLEGYDKHETVYYELGAFAQEHDIGISTVTQVNRNGSAKQKEEALIGIEDVAKSVGKINASDYAFSLNPFQRTSLYQYGVLKSLTSRSTPIQEFVFPFRSLLGMSYYESLDVYKGNAVQWLAIPETLYQNNDTIVIGEMNRAMDADMEAFANLLRPPLVEEQELKEIELLEELARNHAMK